MITPDTLYLHLTRACNLHCAYCYFDAGEPMELELSTAEWIRVLADAAAIGVRRIVFTGGEPLLRADIMQLAAFVRQQADDLPSLCLATNGSLVSTKNAMNLAEVFTEIRVSVDGDRVVHDRYRGQGSFDAAITAIRNLIQAGANTMASITVHALNKASLRSILELLLYNGVGRIHVSPIYATGRARVVPELLCDPEETQSIVEESWRELFGSSMLPHNRDSGRCCIGRYVTVYPDGWIYPCHLLSSPKCRIGHVRKGGLLEACRPSPALESMISRHTMLGLALGVCVGRRSCLL